jgi:RNA polymerase sigma-54 factor
MALTINTQLRQTQKLVMTQSLRQSIEMLQLSTMELGEMIQQELESNPVLELEERTDLPAEDRLSQELSRELSHDEYLESSLYREERRLRDEFYSDDDSSDKNRQFLENALSRPESLSEHLIDQLTLLDLCEDDDTVCRKIITSLDDRGYLSMSRAEFASESGIDSAALDRALDIIASLDPAGCGSVSAKESLLVQAKLQYADDSLLHLIIADHFESLSSLQYDRIARFLGVSVDDVVMKGRIIQSLDPYPGLRFSGGQTRYIIPDIEVMLVDGDISIVFNEEWIPRIRVSRYYAEMLAQKNIDKKLKEYIKGNVTSARALQRNITGWKETIGKIVLAVMTHQREFLDLGPGHLKPLTHSFIAEQAGCHESTVSRATTNKFIRCSWGTFELKEFFVSRIRSDDEGRSSDEVLSLMREIIAEEKADSPYSDDEIVGLLERSGITVARRTVAKYRDILSIPSSSKRKRLNILKAEGTL